MRSSHHHEGLERFSRYKEMQEFGSSSQLLKISSHLKTYPTGLSQSAGASCVQSTLSSFQGLLKVSSCSCACCKPCRGPWQVPMASASV